MFNYIKSEMYRVFCTKSVYYFTILLALASVIPNLLLWQFANIEGESFRYANSSFSYSNLVGNSTLFFILAALVATVLYESNNVNGNLKNTIGFGINRIKIFVGECIVSIITATTIMLVVLAVYILSVDILLEQSGPVELNDLLTQIPAIYLIMITSIISTLFILKASGKLSTTIVVWVLIWMVIPDFLFYIGLKIEAVNKIAMLIPYNFLGAAGMTVNTVECITIWETADGLLKCIVIGIIGIVFYMTLGIIVLRKKEL